MRKTILTKDENVLLRQKVITILENTSAKLTSQEILDIIQKEDSSFPHLNAKILGNSVLQPMLLENGLNMSKNSKKKYSIHVIM